MESLNSDTYWSLVAQNYLNFSFKSGPSHELSSSLRRNITCFLLEDEVHKVEITETWVQF